MVPRRSPRSRTKHSSKGASNLAGLKVGDDLDVTFTQAVVVDLLPPPAK